MGDNSKADAEVMALLADLDMEFGKKPRARKEPDHKPLNKAWHEANPQVRFARTQLDSLKFECYYDWQMHKQALHRLEEAQAEGVPELQWIPDAQVTYVIHQECACCKQITTSIGREYIRFRGRRRNYRTIDGKDRWTYPTMLKPVAEVDGNLLAYGLPAGGPLPDLVDEINETVRRCAGCIMVEQRALDLWTVATQPDPQGELLIDIPLTEDGR